MARILHTDKVGKDTNYSDEDILVMFPASKNYPPEQELDDPLRDLLDEYLDDEDQANDLLKQAKGSDLSSVLPNTLEGPHSEKLLLEEVISRMSYLLQEIEFYTQNR